MFLRATIMDKIFVTNSSFHVKYVFQENILQENEPQKPQKLKKMLRKSPASNAWAAIFNKADFS